VGTALDRPPAVLARLRERLDADKRARAARFHFERDVPCRRNLHESLPGSRPQFLPGA